MTPTPDTRAGRVTEEIMTIFWSEKEPIGLLTSKYNRVYDHVLGILNRELGVEYEGNKKGVSELDSIFQRGEHLDLREQLARLTCPWCKNGVEKTKSGEAHLEQCSVKNCPGHRHWCTSLADEIINLLRERSTKRGSE